MNTSLFVSATPSSRTPNATNDAGGRAYAMSIEHTLAQMSVTGCLNDTYYVTAETQLNKLKEFCDKCSTEWIARVAIYARQFGFMKDVPTFLVAYLSNRPEKALFNFAFDKVIDNVSMARNFCQIIRSGAVGRKSMGTSPKRAVARLFNRLGANRVFYQALGNEPSIEDVIKLCHPKPGNAEMDALYGYLLGKEYRTEHLASDIVAFEKFKANGGTIPHCDFRRLTALNLTDTQWTLIGYGMTWNQLRMNLNTLARHNCYNEAFTAYVVAKLKDPEAIQRAKVLPFAIYNAIEHLDASVPNSVKLALGWCLDASLMNAPTFDGKTLVLVDGSGSMGCAITGRCGGATSTLTCNAAASYFAGSLFKRNPDNVAVGIFDTAAKMIHLNPRDSIESIINSITTLGGGTDTACGIRLAQTNPQYDNILMISDNESWFDGCNGGYRNTTATAKEWAKYRALHPGAKLVCWDIVPNGTIQVKNDKSIMNIGGFTETAYDLCASWFNTASADAFRTAINAIPLS